MTLDYAQGERRRQPGWWAPWVGSAIGLFGCIWMAIGWGGVLTASPTSVAAAGVLLGMLTAAVLPGTAVGTFLGVVSVQRFPGVLAYTALALNLVSAGLGAVGLVWAIL